MPCVNYRLMVGRLEMAGFRSSSLQTFSKLLKNTDFRISSESKVMLGSSYSFIISLYIKLFK